MTAEQLKASVLQMAIEGKLVPQLDDEPAVDIEAVEPEEVPFAIPEKWKWTKIKNIISLTSGRDLSSGLISSTPDVTPYITGASQIEDEQLIVNRWTSAASVYSEFGDILLVCKGSGVGKLAINNVGKVHIARQIMALSPKTDIAKEYLIVFMRVASPTIAQTAKGVIPGISRPDVLEYFVPLPPLAEQRRIVARLNEILPLIEEYGKAHSALENAEQALPDQLRASLLQEAIQGKLVPQLDDEPAVDMAGEEPDEVPFAIPEKWKWVRLLDVVKVIPSKNYQIQTKQVFSEGKFPVVSQSKNYIDGYSDEQEKLLPKEALPIVLFGDHTRVVKFIDFQFVVGADGTKLLHPQKGIDGKFLYHLLQFNVLGMRNRGYSRHFQFLKAIPIPLPPLAEQRRIVARLEELLPHVDAIAGLR